METSTKKTITIESAYTLGDIVFQRVNADRRAGMVTCVSVRKTGVLFEVSWPNGQSSWHYDFELTSEWVPDFSTN